MKKETETMAHLVEEMMVHLDSSPGAGPRYLTRRAQMLRAQSHGERSPPSKVNI
jgi:hypothetical protein